MAFPMGGLSCGMASICCKQTQLTMPTANLRRRRRARPDRRRALELLAPCCDGSTEALMLANGTFTPRQPMAIYSSDKAAD
jgi:hypothetical protein